MDSCDLECMQGATPAVGQASAAKVAGELIAFDNLTAFEDLEAEPIQPPGMR